MEEILITGSTGFVGRHLIKKLVNIIHREKILCLIKDEVDEVEISGRKILEELKIKTKEIDLPSGRGLYNLPKNPKLIIHLAASTESGATDHKCNDIGTKNLLEALSPLSPETKIIFTSTAAVYSGRKDFNKPIDKKTKVLPSNEYGRSKIRAEELLNEYSTKYGFSCCVLRLSTVWGEGTRKNGLFDSIKNLISKNSIIPRLNWPGRTSLIYVNDVAQIIIYFSKTEPKERMQNYILSHEGLTLCEISEIMHKNLNVGYNPVNLPNLFWNSSNMIINKSYILENILPSKFYNTFWRLNLILNDSLYCKPDEIIERIPEINIKLKSFAQEVI